LKEDFKTCQRPVLEITAKQRHIGLALLQLSIYFWGPNPEGVNFESWPVSAERRLNEFACHAAGFCNEHADYAAWTPKRVFFDVIDATCVAHSRIGAQKLARTSALRNLASWYYLYHPCIGPILKKRKRYRSTNIPSNIPATELAD
jgi:hypothetical protein